MTDVKYPITGSVWFRESTQEWVLELEGSIKGTYFLNRHTEPSTTLPEDVPGLPSLYHAADRIEALTKERDQWIAHAKNAIWADSEELKEAEAYAEELEKELNTCRMAQAVMDNTVADLEAKLAKAVALLIEASTDLTAYVDADYPPESCVRYPDIARRHHRDLELVRRIDAAIAEIKGESHDRASTL